MEKHALQRMEEFACAANGGREATAASSLADKKAAAREARQGELRRMAAQICFSLIGFWFCKLKNADGRGRAT